MIRPYQPGDEGGIAHVIRSVFEEHGFPWQPEGHNRDSYEIHAHYHDRGGGFWVLEADGAVVGTVGIRRIDDELCDLCRLYLLADHRGKGLGKQLLQRAVEEARLRGYKQMEIWSDKRLEVSQEMYRRFGAKPIGDRTVADPDYPEVYEEWGYLLEL
jgi:putative acetyltransferase